MTDIAPEMLERVHSVFKLAYETSTVLSDIFQRVEGGTASYVDAHAYAARVGELLASAIRESVSPEDLPDGRMYYNIARRVLDPLLRENYDLAAGVAVRVQESLNRKAGLGLNAVRPKLSEDRIRGIVDTASSAEHYATVSAQVQAQAVNFTQSAVDDTLHANVDAQGKSGLRPRIIRRAHAGCCKWCAALAGEYDYPTISREVYQRHENCNCTTEYDPGYGRRRQNVWDKIWTSLEDRDKLEERKTHGLEKSSAAPRLPSPEKTNTPKSEAENYENITGRWWPDAIPGSHPVLDADEVTVNGHTYKVDGHDVKLDYSAHEKEIAELLEREIGGVIYMLPKVNDPPKIRTPDYLFHGIGYDLTDSGSSGKTALYDKVHDKKGQTNNVILDLSDSPLSDAEIERQISMIYSSTHTRFIDEIIIIKDGKIRAVYKRKKS